MKSEATLDFSAAVPEAFRYRGSARDGRRPPELIDDSVGCESERERPSPPDAGKTTHAHATSDTETPLDFICPHCNAIPGQPCRGTSWTHSVRSALCPDQDPKCATTMNHVTKARCKSRRSVHIGDDLNCPGDPRRTFQYATPRGMVSFSEGEVDLLDKLVRGALHGRSMDAAARHPEMHGLRAKVNGLSAQVARRHAERGDT